MIHEKAIKFEKSQRNQNNYARFFYRSLWPFQKQVFFFQESCIFSKFVAFVVFSRDLYLITPEKIAVSSMEKQGCSLVGSRGRRFVTLSLDRLHAYFTNICKVCHCSLGTKKNCPKILFSVSSFCILLTY